MNVFQKDIINIIKSSLDNSTPNLSNGFKLSEAYGFAKEQHLAGLMYYGLKNEPSVQEDSYFSKLSNIFLVSAVHSERQMIELERITSSLNKNNINYTLLKGAVLKKIYPHADMRLMGDVDIYYSNPNDSEKISEVMTELGYCNIPGSDHEYVWQKGNALRVEFHNSLMSKKNPNFHRYYSEIIPIDKLTDSAECVMKPEDCFIYLFVHFTKHFEEGGAGVKFIVDLYVYIKNYKSLDYDYISEEMDKLHIGEFYKNIMKLIRVWFYDEPNDKITDFITDKLFLSGVFGNSENADAFAGLRSAEKGLNPIMNKTVHLIFPGFDAMRKRYSVLNKCPILLPILWIVRCFDLLLFKRNRIKKQCSAIGNMTKKKILTKEQELNYVGINNIGGTE